MGKKRKRRHYDDKFRSSAVIMVEADGSIMRVAKHLKIPESTLRSWVNRHERNNKMPQGAAPPTDIYDEKKADFIGLLKKAISDAFHELPDKWSEATAREIATAIGIFIDKMQLLEGEPTERKEIVNERRDKLLADVAAKSGGYVTRETAEIHSRIEA